MKSLDMYKLHPERSLLRCFFSSRLLHIVILCRHGNVVLTEARSSQLAQGQLQLLVPVDGIMGLVMLFGVCSLVQLQQHAVPLSENHREASQAMA